MEKICPKCASPFGPEQNVCPGDGAELTARGDVSDPFIGLVLDGRLKVERYLGAGGMGHVYIGRQLDATQRLVATKFIRHELMTSEEVEKRFFREIRTLANSAHSNVVSVFFSGHAEVADKRIPYFAMELLDGHPLDEVLAEKRTLPLQEACRVTLAILRGLAALHRSGIIHRDLKPANVMLLDEEAGEVKILDFGLARAKDVDPETKITSSRMVIGTPLYMSPEQMMGWELDERSDLYAVGVIVHELVTGKRPRRDGKGVPVPPGEFLAQFNLPSSLTGLIADLLSFDREQRPATVADVQARLQKVLDEVTTSRAEAEKMALQPTRTADDQDPGTAPTLASPVPFPADSEVPTLQPELVAPPRRRLPRFAGGLLVAACAALLVYVGANWNGKAPQKQADPPARQEAAPAGLPDVRDARAPAPAPEVVELTPAANVDAGHETALPIDIRETGTEVAVPEPTPDVREAVARPEVRPEVRAVKPIRKEAKSQPRPEATGGPAMDAPEPTPEQKEEDKESSILESD